MNDMLQQYTRERTHISNDITPEDECFDEVNCTKGPLYAPPISRRQIDDRTTIRVQRLRPFPGCAHYRPFCQNPKLSSKERHEHTSLAKGASACTAHVLWCCGVGNTRCGAASEAGDGSTTQNALRVSHPLPPVLHLGL
jgi:hypothetical protein